MITTLDMDGRYAVAGWKGIAFRLAGFPRRWEPCTYLAECEDPYCSCHDDASALHECEDGDGEWVEQDASCGRVLAVMVGDDKQHEVDIADLTPLAEGAYCGCCGQIGCHWGSA